jgi:hypothetical protein
MVDHSYIAHITFVVVLNFDQSTHLIVTNLLRLLNYAEQIWNFAVVMSVNLWDY